MKQSLIIALLFFVGCTRVPPGYVGIKVNMYGSQKGVDDFPLQTGRVWYNLFTEEVHDFPTFMQNVVWTKDKNEGSPNDESITFNSKEGSSIQADVGLSYSLETEKVPHIFVEFRQDIDVITDGYLRNKTRDAFNRHAGQYKAIEIFGEKKQSLLDEVKMDLQEQLAEKGFVIDTVSFVSAPIGDSRVMDSISSVIQSTQRAIEAENLVRQKRAEAEQAVATAEGKAKAILTEAEAQAKANKLITESISGELIKYRALEKWDGVAPKVFGGNSNLLVGINEITN